ncbi:hypothetical protein ACHAPE_006746 [Trichoderma viride]
MSDRYQSRSKMSAEDYATYGQTRQKLYPTTHRDAHPSADAERDYNRYKQRTGEANASGDQYLNDYKKHTGSRDTPIGTLTQGQHSIMILPAAEAATDTLSHAQARDNFLEEHPYGYQTGRKRYNHEGLADSAYGDAAYYRDRYATHQSGSTKSSPFAPLGAKEPYWQLDRITGQYCHIERDGTIIYDKSGEHSSSSAARRR